MLKTLLIAAFLNAIAWIIIIPIWQYPDEQAHFAQVQDIAEVGKVPTGPNTSEEVALSEKILGTQRDTAGNNKFTYHPEFRLNYSQNLYGPGEKEIASFPKSSRTHFIKNEATQNPPLYYFLASRVYKLFSSGSLFTRVFAVRFFSAFLFLLTVIVAFLSAKIIFPAQKKMPLIFTSFVAFTPMLVFSSTGVLPDPLTNLLFSLIILFSLKTLIYGIRLQILLLTLALLVLGAMTRQHILIAIPIALAPFFLHLLKAKNGLVVIIAASLVIGLIVYFANTIGTAVPVINNLRIPDGSNLDLTLTFRKSLIDHTLWTLGHTYREVLPWYWGVYRWLSMTLPHFIYRTINMITLISIIGIIWRFAKIAKNRKLTQTDKSLAFLIFSLAIYFVSLTIWDYFFRLRNNFSFGIQGRYFFPVIIPIMSIILIGLWEIFTLVFRKLTKYALFILVVAMIIFNNFSLYFVAGSYYNLASLGTFILEVSQYKPLFLKGNIIIVTVLLALVSQLIFLFFWGLATLKDKNESR